MLKTKSPKPMTVPGRFAVKYWTDVDGEHKVAHIEPYNKEHYRRGDYVFHHITVSAVDELDALKVALDVLKTRSEDFRRFLDGFVKKSKAE